jgi:hypothetical protein
LRVADLEQPVAAKAPGAWQTVHRARAEVGERDGFCGCVDDVGPRRVVDEFGDHAAHGDVLVVVHLGVRLGVVGVVHVGRGEVVHVAAAGDEELHECRPVVQIDAVRLLVLGDRIGEGHQPPTHHVRPAPPVGAKADGDGR